MYYISDNIVVSQPNVFSSFETPRISETPYSFFPLDELLPQISVNILHKDEINDRIIGHTNSIRFNTEILNQWEEVCTMAFDNVNFIFRNFVTAKTALDDIKKLTDNWNDNNAKAFSPILIDKCRRILDDLVAEPFVCPTARGSIQFEYEKDDGKYLEFEIFEDRIEVYCDMLTGEVQEEILSGTLAINRMRQLVVDFYG